MTNESPKKIACLAILRINFRLLHGAEARARCSAASTSRAYSIFRNTISMSSVCGQLIKVRETIFAQEFKNRLATQTAKILVVRREWLTAAEGAAMEATPRFWGGHLAVAGGNNC